MDATPSLDLTAQIVAQPSAMLPGIPPFVFSLPLGWVLDEAPGALALIRLPEEIDGFLINGILSHDKVSRTVDFKEAAAFTWQRLKAGCPDAEVSMEKFMQLGGRPVFLRATKLSAPKSGRALSQLQSIWFAPTNGPGKVVDFFQCVFTCPAEHVAAVSPQALHFLASFKFV
ncbi:MAG: hypothetical protein JWL72_3586 [Ilumatobacteraceae bacterium]|nr:hypothetical protein [Ilumatobacteraceae bacterium]MCU1390248.1 hypothetical protein [Ilumatobacteraceae bacterium]